MPSGQTETVFLVGAEFANGMFISLLDAGIDRNAALSLVPICIRARNYPVGLCDRLARLIKPFMLRLQKDEGIYVPAWLDAEKIKRWRSLCSELVELSGDNSGLVLCSFTMAASCQGVHNLLQIPREGGEFDRFSEELFRVASIKCPDIFNDILAAPEIPDSVQGNAISVSTSGSGEHVIYNIQIATVFAFHALSESVRQSPDFVLLANLPGRFSRIEVRKDATGRHYMSVFSNKAIHLEAGTAKRHHLRLSGSAEYEEIKQLMADYICSPMITESDIKFPFVVTLVFENSLDCEDLCFLFANS